MTDNKTPHTENNEEDIFKIDARWESHKSHEGVIEIVSPKVNAISPTDDFPDDLISNKFAEINSDEALSNVSVIENSALIPESNSDVKNSSIQGLVDRGYYPFNPTLEYSKLYIDDAVSTKDIKYIIVVVHQDLTNPPILLCTKETYRLHRNAITTVKNICQKNKLPKLIINYAAATELKSFILESEIDSTLFDDSREDEPDITAAKGQFIKIVGDGLKQGASDYYISYNKHDSYYCYSTDGSMGKRENLTPYDAKAMVNAMFNTESENMTGSLEDDQVLSKNISVEPTYVDKHGKKRREIVRLRAEKVAAHGGYTLSCRIIKTNQQSSMSLKDLGFEDSQYQSLLYLKDLPTGIILIVGPTGHGKSITLKAFYEAMNPKWRIIVIEDPVEYIINHPYVTQENVVPDKGLTIKKYIKSSLRQFPKVIGISEIRDIEVAEEVINISLSGHKMVATMHANDALAVLPRLDTIGVSFKKQAQAGLISSTMSQRLLPKLCSKCKVKSSTEEFGEVFIKNPNGCATCEFKGIDGRCLVGEIIIFDSHVRDLLKHDRFNEILPYLKTMGWRSMLDVGISKVKKGLVDPKDLFQSLGDSKNTLGSQFDYRKNSFVQPKDETKS
jgi:general secretion pathway protein E